MSRKDHILALAIGKNDTKSKPGLQRKTSVTAPKQKSSPVPTDINEIWSRPYNFEDFPAVFDYQNEYSNSTQSAQDICLARFKASSPKTRQQSTRLSSLMCYETMELSGEENSDNDFCEDSDDSVKDKNYTPQLQHNTHSSSDSDSEAENSFVQILVQADLHGSQKQLNNMSSENVTKTVIAEKMNQDNEERVEKIELEISKTRECKSMETADEDISGISFFKESNDRDKDYLPELREIINSSFDSDTENTAAQILAQADVHEFNNNQVNNNSSSEMATERVFVGNINEYNEEIMENISFETEDQVLPDDGKGFTKSGLPRKRRKIDTTLAERKIEKKQIEEEKLSLKPPCEEKCRQKCRDKITEEKRKEIHDQYVKLNWESRGLFIKGMVEPRSVKCRTTGDSSNDSAKKNISYFYYLLANNEKIQVCKTFFLTTLGYNAKNDRRLNLALHKEVDDQKDKRGSYERKNVIDKNIIREHINSFDPTISHHRREHSPKRLYLPSDLNITLLFHCFQEKYPNVKVSAETYRKVLKEMNISFANLGHEECEQCCTLKNHAESDECSPGCTNCIKYNNHVSKYTQSRQEYQDDVKKASLEKECIYYSVDLQKVIMLPRMDQFKAAIFCHRIIAFNESFVPLGPTTNENMPFATIWNESICGRNCEDIISAFKAFLISKRDVKSIVLWADNCSAQNKNWAFLCFLVNTINSDIIAADSIIIKYFEPGHSFMSADHFHHQVELSMKKKNKLYDFKDFVDAVQMSNSKKTIVKVMDILDFYNYKDVSSQHRIRNQKPRIYLTDIVCVKAERGEFGLKYKTRYDGQWEVLNFLQVAIQKNKTFPEVTTKTEPRGVTIVHKLEIISKLVPLMPETRRDFWKNLPVCRGSVAAPITNID